MPHFKSFSFQKNQLSKVHSFVLADKAMNRRTKFVEGSIPEDLI